MNKLKIYHACNLQILDHVLFESIFPIIQNVFLYKVVNVILKATNIILMC